MTYSTRWVVNDGLVAGDRKVSPEWVVLNVPNANAPPTQLRRVPLSSVTHMQMLGIAYGVSSWLSLSAGTSYLEKRLETLTFSGMAGTVRRGISTEDTEGLGDSRIGANVKLFQAPGQQLHAGLALTLPTGSITERVRPLLPNGTIGDSRAGYSMQLGTGTVDLAPALTWFGHQGAFGWGAAYRGRLALEDANAEGYRVGDMHLLTGWATYRLTPLLWASGRLEASTQDRIHGRDPQIAGAGVGADPANFGGERVEGFLGLDARGPVPGLGVARLGVEVGVPFYERANGVHLARDWSAQISAAIRF